MNILQAENLSIQELSKRSKEWKYTDLSRKRYASEDRSTGFLHS
jgi:hypothetical protein